MIDNLINEIEQAMLPVLDNGQLSQLRKVLEYAFRNVSVTERESVNTESSNHIKQKFTVCQRKKRIFAEYSLLRFS